MFEQSFIKKSIKIYGSDAIFIDLGAQIFSEKECNIDENIKILLINNSYDLPLRKFVNGKLITLPNYIHTLKIKKGNKDIWNAGKFNQSLDFLPNLENLVLNSFAFTQPLDNLPISLKQLKINCNQIKNIDVGYLKNLTKLESYTSNFVSVVYNFQKKHLEL